MRRRSRKQQHHNSIGSTGRETSSRKPEAIRIKLLGGFEVSVGARTIEEVSMAPSPVLAEEATQISGVAFFDEEDVCDSGSKVADFALIMTGDLEGCLYTFVETAESSPSGTYRETGTELFVASDGVSTFETNYRFEAKYEDVENLSGEIFGRCQHPIVEGSGTGIFEGVSGQLFFKDDVEAGTFPYRGHLQY